VVERREKGFLEELVYMAVYCLGKELLEECKEKEILEV
jgi:hypothetical protein